MPSDGGLPPGATVESTGLPPGATVESAGDTGAKVSAEPSFGTIPWLKQKGWQAVEAGIGALPTLGAMTGGVLATPAALATGPWAPAVIAGGAGLGGAAGQAAKMSARQALGWEQPTPTSETAKQVALEGMAQATMAAAGEVPGMAARTVAPALKGLGAMNPVEQEAIRFGLSQDVPITAAQVGNKFVKSAQALAASSPGGSIPLGGVEAAQKQAMRRVGSELATEAFPGAPQIPESAATEVKATLTKRIEDLKQQADAAYDQYKQIVKANVQPVTTGQQQVTSGMVDQFGKPITATVPVTQDIATPIDMRDIKAQLTPIYEQMSQWMQPAKQQASPGYTAMGSIVNGPDFRPVLDAEAGLSGLKSLARDADPNMANVNQGIAKFAAVRLQNQIDSTVYRDAGQDALNALQNGRALHAQKMETYESLQSLRDEPVQAFNQLTMAKDAGINKLREVAQLAPADMPKVGRAFVEDMLTKPTASGGFENGQSMWSKWENLGPETKKILYPDPNLRNNLDNFFLLARKLAENPNPSGSATVGSVGGTLAILMKPHVGVPVVVGGYGLAKLLQSPRTVSYLLDAMSTQAPSTAVGGGMKASLAIGNIVRAAGQYAHEVRSNQDANRFVPAFGSEQAAPQPQQ